MRWMMLCGGFGLMLALGACSGRERVQPIKVAPEMLTCPDLPAPPPQLLMRPAREPGEYLSTLPLPR